MQIKTYVCRVKFFGFLGEPHDQIIKTESFIPEFGLGLAIMGIIIGLTIWKIGLTKNLEVVSV